MSLKRITLLGLSIMIVLSMLLSACGGGTPEPTEPSVAEEAPAPEEEAPPEEQAPPEQEAPPTGEITENVAIQAVSGSMPNLDPDYMLTVDHALGFMLYETLTFWTPDQGVLPKLATSWESNEDATEWIFHLREGVTFHDGTPFTAEAVKFSYERTIEVGLMWYYFLELTALDILDEYTIKLTFSAPRPAPVLLSAGYGMFIVNPNITDQPEGWLEEGHDVGTGPYTIETVDPGTRWVLTKYDDYWGGWEEGQFTKIVYTIVEDTTVREQLLRTGEADMTNQMPYDAHAALEASGEITVDIAAQYWNLYASLQLDKPPMDNLDFRQALAYAFPYDVAAEATYGGWGTIANGVVPKGLWQVPDDFVRPNYDLDKAREFMAQSGLPEGQEVRMATQVGEVDAMQALLLWQAELAKIEVDLKIVEITNGSWWENAYNPDSEFDGMLVNWAPGWPSAFEFGINYHSVFTFTPYQAYANPIYEELLLQGLESEATGDQEAANQLYAQMQQILYEDAAGIFMLDLPIDFVYRNDITGFVANPNYFDVVFWYDMMRE